MINKLLRIVAPHYCYGCQKIGSVLCDNCKYDIVDDAISGCIVCTAPSLVGICSRCRTTYDRAWCVGDRSGVLQNVIDALKFERVSDAADSLASLLDDSLPELPSEVIVVPVPTIPSHIRQRGYDHSLLIATAFARRRRLSLDTSLSRTNARFVQRGSNKLTRLRQAKSAFACAGSLNPDKVYLLIDDVVTTNATVRYAAEALRSAGTSTVWVAVLARQPLDKVT